MRGISLLAVSLSLMAQRSLMGLGLGLLIIEASRAHSETHQDSTGRVISPTQRPLHDNTQHSQETDIHATRRDSNPVATDPRLISFGHCVRQLFRWLLVILWRRVIQ
jgi:hypothetical protein